MEVEVEVVLLVGEVDPVLLVEVVPVEGPLLELVDVDGPLPVVEVEGEVEVVETPPEVLVVGEEVVVVVAFPESAA